MMYFRRTAGKKYKNIKVEHNGIKFDSKLELKYYLHLKDREGKGEIEQLELQYKYLLQDSFISSLQYKMCKKTFVLQKVYTNAKQKSNLIRKIEYIADFVYFDKILNMYCCVDTKGFETTDYKIKKKLLLYLFELKAKRSGKTTLFIEIK